MPHVLAGLPVLRMNGAGNEILVLDLRGAGLAVSPQEARAIARQPGSPMISLWCSAMRARLEPTPH